MRNPPRGLLKGRPGSLGAIKVGDAALEATASPAAAVPGGESLRFLLPGGGGYGDPKLRDRGQIESDLRNGYISSEAARRDYNFSK
jgi:N-methylhydantoinase B